MVEEVKETGAKSVENKKVAEIQYAPADDPRVASGDDRMYYRLVYEDGTIGDWERSEVYVNQPEKFAQLKERLNLENGLKEVG